MFAFLKVGQHEVGLRDSQFLLFPLWFHKRSLTTKIKGNKKILNFADVFIIYYLIGINVLTFLAHGLDKWKANTRPSTRSYYNRT